MIIELVLVACLKTDPANCDSFIKQISVPTIEECHRLIPAELDMLDQKLPFLIVKSLQCRPQGKPA